MFFYTLGIFFYRLMIGLAAPFHAKARKMLEGRRQLLRRLEEEISRKRGNAKLIWFHVASLGEFEQGRPVMEALRKKYPGVKILLTFFSPSGYEVRKDYEGADFIFYIPFDFPSGAKKFLAIAKPDLAVFIKYEFWLNFLNELNRRQVPVYLVSAVFHPGQPFFRWYGNRFIHALHSYRHIFAQDKVSYDLLGTLKIKNRSISGDTRFDRVLQVVGDAKEIPLAEKFCGETLTLVAGSTYPREEEMLLGAIEKLWQDGEKIKLIIAPHEVNDSTISGLKKVLTEKKISFALFSGGASASEGSRVLVIDNIGMLAALYRYGKIAYVGGGFGNGIHNIIEAAAWGMPVIFGPNYYKFNEAHVMIDEQCAFAVRNEEELLARVKWLAADPSALKAAAARAAAFVKSSAGATEKVIGRIGPDLQ